MTELFNPQTEETDEQILARMKEKYGDEAKIAKAKAEADRHIKRIEAENAGMREDLSKRKTMEEFMAEIKASRTEPRFDEQIERREEHQSPTFKPEDIDKLVETKLSERLTVKEKETLARNNVAFAQQELTKAWGPNFPEKLIQAQKALGVSQEYLAKMAEDNPQVFLKLVVGSPSPTQAPNVTPPKGMTGFQSNNNSGGKNFAYYEKLRKEDNAKYWSRQVQNEMHAEAERQGADFYK